MKRSTRITLIVVAVCSFGIALSYPVIYKKNQESNEKDLNALAALRREIMSEQDAAENETGEETSPVSGGAGGPEKTAGDSADAASGTGDAAISPGVISTEEMASEGLLPDEGARDGVPREGASADGKSQEGTREEGQEGAKTPASQTSAPEETETEKTLPGLEDLVLDYVPGLTWRQVTIPEYESLDAPVFVSGRTAAKNRDERLRGIPYDLKEKVELDENKILPELLPIYEQNHDLTGWISIEDTVIDYPVVQTADSEFYLKHDFYGEENVNGQIILDTKCDNYTPSYNLVVSGHHMRNGSMFGNLQLYSSYDYWSTHKIVEFDNLMERRKYVVVAAFYSADYDEYEEGFRYNRDIVYEMDARMWLEEIDKVKLYDTAIDVRFGDEFITLTTCDRSRRQDGRFVLIGRRVREGEEIS